MTDLDAQLSFVNFVWISHAHLDHYGDLPIVVQAIASAKRELGRITRRPSKPVLVVAPSKVLKYLDVLLRRSGSSTNDDVYAGVTHREFRQSPFAGHLRALVFDHALPVPPHPRRDVRQSDKTEREIATEYYRPFASLRNVEVEHCREAFALVLELNVPSENERSGGGTRSDERPSSFVLCFSGDTRPSDNLIRGCLSRPPDGTDPRARRQNRHCRRQGDAPPPPPPPRVSLLIHEATFLDDPRGRTDAVKKRHSTVAEALRVAKRVGAGACLLTHFSQRYRRVSVEDVVGRPPDDGRNPHPFGWGVASDGMMLPLTRRALSKLFGLSRCVDALTTSSRSEGT